MRFLIEHDTRLRYDRPVREHQCELRLTPRTNGQVVHDLSIGIRPDATTRSYEDAWGNQVTWFGVLEAHDELALTMRARVETSLGNPFAYEPVASTHERTWIAEALRRRPRLWDYVLHRSPAVADLTLHPLPAPQPEPPRGRPLIESVRKAVEWIRANFTYDPNVTHVHSALTEVLEARAGVCQDFAHLLIAIVRSWDIPARYVVGYIDPGSAAEADAGQEQATHAWAEVLIPGAGWRGFDATNGLVVNDAYVIVAVGRDYADAAPQRGSFKGDAVGAPPMVRVRVERESESEA